MLFRRGGDRLYSKYAFVRTSYLLLNIERHLSLLFGLAKKVYHRILKESERLDSAEIHAHKESENFIDYFVHLSHYNRYLDSVGRGRVVKRLKYKRFYHNMGINIVTRRN